MVTVNVSIEAVVLNCDETVSQLVLGNGYTIQKKPLDDIKNKLSIHTKGDELLYEYQMSALHEGDNVSFMVLNKSDVITLDIPETSSPEEVTSRVDKVLEVYHDGKKNVDGDDDEDGENKYLTKIFSMLTVFKTGNPWLKDIFVTFEDVDLFPEPRTIKRLWVSNKAVMNTSYTLSDEEIQDCNLFLQRTNSHEVKLLQQAIYQFVWALEQVDKATGLLMFITTLEMMLVHKKENLKSELLAKRCAVIAYTDDVNMKKTFNLMKDLYRFRSEYVHAGKDNICSQNLSEAEELSRHLLKIILEETKCFLDTKPSKDFHQFKSNLVNKTTRKVKRAEKRQVFRK